MNTVGNLKDGVAGILSGTNLDKVTNVNGAIERAARKLLQKADVPEAQARESITLYDGVFDYPVNANIFGGALVDLRPQGADRTILDDVQKQSQRQFDREKGYYPSGYKVTFETVKGVPRLRVSSPKPMARVILDRMNVNDDWVAGGSVGTIHEDNIVYYEGPGSLRFTMTGSSTGTLTKTINQLNLSSYEDVGVAFLALRLIDAPTSLTSVAVRIGSSDTAYDEVSATQGFLGAFVAGDWMLIALDLASATSTGTPDWSAIDYIQVRLAHTATLTNVRVGGLWIAQPCPHEVIYQTAAIFLANGSLSRTITNDDDQIILSDPAYLLFEHETALVIAQQKGMTEKATQLEATLYVGRDQEPSLYAQYRGDNPSQELRTIGNYY